jgi:hypothetical protein
MLLTLLGVRLFFSKLVKKGSMLLTLFGDRFSFQVGEEGVDVTNSAWGPTFSKLVSYMTEGSMLLTLLGDRFFFSKLVSCMKEWRCVCAKKIKLSDY